MYACIDLGSNSFHILIGKWHDGGIEIVERYSEKVQLSEGVRIHGKISPDAYVRGLSCLQNFKQLMDQYPIAQYWALGTNTFRIAENAPLFIDDARDIGLDIEPISGIQEAMLIYAGVVSGLASEDEQRLVVDIGGGSTEVVLGIGKQCLITESLDVGCVAWRDQYFTDIPQEREALLAATKLATDEAERVFSAVEPGLTSNGWQQVYASSGTAKMLSLICHAHGSDEGIVDSAQILRLHQKMIDCIVEGTELPGLKEKRRELLLPGCSVMLGLMQAFAVSRIVFSATALREGMLDFMATHKSSPDESAISDLPSVKMTKS